MRHCSFSANHALRMTRENSGVACDSSSLCLFYPRIRVIANTLLRREARSPIRLLSRSLYPHALAHAAAREDRLRWGSFPEVRVSLL